MTAEHIIKAIDKMDNGDLFKLLNTLAEKHFGKKPSIEEIRTMDYEAV